MNNYENLKEQLVENLKNVYDPEIPVNIYDLGLIYDLILEDKEEGLHCTVIMTLTSPACPVAESLVEHVKYHTLQIEEIKDVRVELTFNPPWDKSKMSEEAVEIMAMSGASI